MMIKMIQRFILATLCLQAFKLTLLEAAKQQVQLSDSYLPVAMQVIAHLVDQMAFEVKEEPGSRPPKPATKPSTTAKPLDVTTPFHRPGYYAPAAPPKPSERLTPQKLQFSPSPKQQQHYYVPLPNPQLYIPPQNQQQYNVQQSNQKQHDILQQPQQQYNIPQPIQQQFINPLESQQQQSISPENHQQYNIPPQNQQQYNIPPENQQQQSISPENQQQYNIPPQNQQQFNIPSQNQQQYIPSENQQQHNISPENQQQYNIPPQNQQQSTSPENRQQYNIPPQNQQQFNIPSQNQQQYIPSENQQQPNISPENRQQYNIPPQNQQQSISPENQQQYNIPPQNQEQQQQNISPENQQQYNIPPQNQQHQRISPENQQQYNFPPQNQKYYIPQQYEQGINVSRRYHGNAYKSFALNQPNSDPLNKRYDVMTFDFPQYNPIQPLHERNEEPLLSAHHAEVKPLLEPTPDTLPLLPPHFETDVDKISSRSKGFDLDELSQENLQYLSQDVREMIRMAHDPHDERLVDVWDGLRAHPAEPSPKGKLSSSNLRLLLLYDLLSREAKRQRLSDYSGFSPDVMKTLVESSGGGARAQLSMALSKMVERHDCGHDYANNRAKEMVVELGKDESKLSSEIRYLQPLIYKY